MGLAEEQFANTNKNFKTVTFNVTDGYQTITPKAVTVKANNASKIYDNNPANPATYTATATGLIGSDKITYSVSRAAGEDVGTYTITPAGDEKQGNYTVTYETGTFEITPAAATIKVNDASKTYGDADPTFTGTVTGLVNAADLGTVKYIRSNEEEDAGSYSGVLTAEYTDNKNYTVSVEKGDFTINAKDVTITVADASKVYGAADPAFTGTVDGLVKDGDLGTITYSRSNTAENAGTYADVLTANFTANKNYNVTVNTGDFEITKKTATITANNANKVYGEADPAFTGTVDGLVNDGDLGTVSYSRTNDDEKVGEYKGVIKPSYTENDNYDVSVVNGDFSITRSAQMTATAAELSKTYDGTALAASATATAPDGSEVTISYCYKNEDGTWTDWSEDAPSITNAGTLEYKVRAENPNYDTVEDEGTLTITRAEATITVADANKTFGDADPAFTGTVTGLADGDSLGTITYSRTNDDEDAGTYEGVITAEAAGNSNYTVNVVPGDFTIDPAAVTIKADNKTKVYGQADPDLTATVTGLKSGDTIEYTISRESGENVGVYTITPAQKTSILDRLMGNRIGNYDVVFETGTLTITRAPLTIRTPSAEKTYDGTALTADGATIEGLVNGDAATVTATGLQTEVGSSTNGYSIEWTRGTSDNYNITTYLGILTVAAAGDDDDDNPGGGGGNPGGGGGNPDGGGNPVVNPGGGNPDPGAVVPDDPTPTTEPPTTVIDDPEPPLAEGTWALLNLLSAIVTALGAAVALFRKKEEEDDENDPEGTKKPKNDGEEEEEKDNRGKKMLAAKIAGAVAGVASPITFLLTEDMSNPMALTDKWTILMLAMLAGQVVAAVLNKRASKLDEEEEENAEAAAN